jgi:hypothetical protein
MYDAIVEGDITEFWITNDIEARLRISIFIRALDPDSRRVVWDRDYRASKRNLLLFATQSEFEDLISQTLGMILNQAAQEFASDSFHKAAIKNNMRD